jgi:hypothetical protein
VIFKHNFHLKTFTLKSPTNYFWLLPLSSTIYFSNFYILSELHNLNLKFLSKQFDKIDILHQIVAPQLSGGFQYNCPTKTGQAGCANEQSMESLMSMKETQPIKTLNKTSGYIGGHTVA